MLLDSDNTIQKTVAEISITYDVLFALGFTIDAIDIESDGICLRYRDTNLDFAVHTSGFLLNTNLTVTTLNTNKRREFTNVDQLMNYINDTGYGQ